MRCIQLSVCLRIVVKLLAIDKGNSRTKAGLRDTNGVLKVSFFANNAEDALLDFIKKQDFDASVMSSVAATDLSALSALLTQAADFLLVDSSTAMPIKNSYATPQTLGTDRIAGAIGAWALSGKQDILLMDAGTCINYECIINHTYLGGAIAPGLRMRLKAMHEFTGKLPLLDLPETEISLIGNSTANCMLTGAVLGMVKEMEGMAAEYILKYPQITTVLAGGDAAYLGKYLKNSIFAPHNEVVLVGLLEILKFNLNVEN